MKGILEASEFGDRISEVWGENEGVWKSLDAVKNDRVLQLDSYLFWGNDAISLKQQNKFKKSSKC